MADELARCLKAAKAAGAIDVVRVAHSILSAVQHRHSPEQAISQLRHWQPGLFKGTRHLKPPTILPPIDRPLSPETLRAVTARYQQHVK